MTGNIEWNNIRSINGSQKEGFEELVCQLARNEKFENSKTFIRKGTPDAGVECYWILQDESEIAWQAKFFTSPLNNGQWSEIDKSVKTALEKHPNLKQYNISIPQNRADARLEGKESFLQKWNSRVSKWNKLAEERGMKVLFNYEGSSELLEKISKPINNGKLFFWFNKNEFTDEWFKNQNEEKIENLGARYSPILNINLDVKYVFEGLYFNLNFKNKTTSALLDIENKSRILFDLIATHKLNKDFESLKKIFEQYTAQIKEIDFINSSNYSGLVSAITFVHNIIVANFKKIKLLEIEDNSKEELKQSLKKLTDSLHFFKDSFSHFDSNLAENPFLIIEGDAGKGKSHLIADVITEKINQNQFSILLLGQHFQLGEIWEQILKELHINCSKDELLGALNSKAEQIGSRIIIYIDAINEGEGKKIWNDRLLGFFKEIKKYNFLGLVLTIRSSYKDLILPDNIYNDFKHFEHRGFGINTKDAVKKFFEYYKIQEPPIPLLNPEFSNPLFLKLYCKGLHDNNIFKIPEGYSGITEVFSYVITAANKAISKRLDFEFKSFNLVSEAIDILIQRIIESPTFILKKEIAYKILTEKFSLHVNDSRKILSELVNENILNENAHYNPETKKFDSEIIYFSYERFGDHLIINSILETEKNQIEKNQKINENSLLYRYIKDERSIMQNLGLIEALSIQLPEKIGLELYEIVDNNKIYYLGEAFLESFLWRRSDTLNKKVFPYINNYILKVNGLLENFLEKLIHLSIKEKHFFNADFLFKHLFNKDLNKRDAFWTININDMYFENSIIKILIDWTKESKTIKLIDKETKRLLSITLAWFLSSTNRSLRDNSTKALVKLCENDLFLLKNLIKKFNGINDLYIIERLYAVSYGSTLRSNDKDQIKSFSEFIYSETFEEKIPTEHLLLRDYARGIIEYSTHKGLLNIPTEKYNPPYGSQFHEIPSEKDILKHKNKNSKKVNAKERLFSVIMNGSDFCRDEIGTDHESNYLELKIETFNTFESLLQVLTKEEEKIIERIEATFYFILSNRITSKQVENYYKEIRDLIDIVFKTDSQKSNEIFDYLKNKSKSQQYGKGKFDLSILQRLILRDVFEFSAWSEDLFGNYDFNKIHFFSRHESNEIEAIGMKYTWIAYHKWLSVIFDNHIITNINNDEKFGIYKGAWNPYKRDIDPTILISKSHNEKFDSKTEYWWNTNVDIDWGNLNIEKDWCLNANGIPNPKDIIELNYENTNWLNLFSYPSWRKDLNDNLHFDIWYHIKSYVVKIEHKEDIIKALANKNFFNHAIQQERSSYEVFSRESYWSSAYKECIGFDDWQPLHSKIKNKKIKGAITAYDYMWQENKDYSKEENINVLRPSKIVFDLMDLEFKEDEHKFYDKETGEMIIFDPTIEYQCGKTSLLIKKDVFLKKLQKNGFDVIWLILGAKEIINQRIIHEGQINSVFYFDDKNNLCGNFNIEEPKFR